MIEDNNIISCITIERDNVSKLNKLKQITYLCNETIIEKKVNNKFVTENRKKNYYKSDKSKNNNSIKNYNKFNKFTKYPNYPKYLNNFNSLKDKNLTKLIFLKRDEQIKVYRRNKEKFKKRIINKFNRYKEIINLMNIKARRISFNKNNLNNSNI